MSVRLRLTALALLLAAAAARAAEPVRAIVRSDVEPAGLTVLDRRGDRWLVLAEPDALAAWPGARLAPVPASPAAPPRVWDPVKSADPFVQGLVDQVTWPDLLATVEAVVGWGTRYTYMPNLAVVADSLLFRLRTPGRPAEQLPFELGPHFPENVVGTQTGVLYPDSIFVVCAHYDAISQVPDVSTPGADDNASGTTGVLTCARLFASYETDYTVQYVLFAGEEQGMEGSAAWVQDQLDAGATIVGALNLDMIGWWRDPVPFDLEIETNAHSRWLADAICNAADLYTGMPYELHEDDDAWWGDFYRFWQRGYCAVNHEESWDWGDPDFNPWYHTTGDTPSRLDPDFMTGSVKVAVAALATLAGVRDPAADAGPPAAGPAVRLSAAPDPFNGRTELRLAGALRDGSHVVEIFDVSGRRVGRVFVEVEAGRGAAAWDAVDRSTGAPLASGVYLARVAGRPAAAPCRLTHVK